MKKIFLITIVFVGLMITGCAITNETTSVDKVDHHPDPTFKALNNYGTWVKIPDYGSVWKPYAADGNWLPYSDGRWTWTDKGWFWDSNEPYGWIVYHYGHWQFTDYDGWFWIPDYNWMAERVVWYNSDNYIGWAPLPKLNIDQSLLYNDKYTRKIWVVVAEKNFAGQNIKRHFDVTFVPGASVLQAGNGGRAPEKNDIERVSERTVEVAQLISEQVNTGGKQLLWVSVASNDSVSDSTLTDQANQVDPDIIDDETDIIAQPVEDAPSGGTIEPVLPSDPGEPGPIIDPPRPPHHKPPHKQVPKPKPINVPVKTPPKRTRPEAPKRPTASPGNKTPIRNNDPVRTHETPKTPAPSKTPSRTGTTTPARTPAPTRTPASTGTPARTPVPTRTPASTGTAAPSRTPASAGTTTPAKTVEPTPVPVRGNNNDRGKKDERR
jgi:hypothetical protein